MNQRNKTKMKNNRNVKFQVSQKDQFGIVEETFIILLIRNILVETGYKAGQHELLVEHVTRVEVKEIQKKSSEFHKKIKENSKHAKMEKEKMDSSYLKLEKPNLNIRKDSMTERSLRGFPRKLIKMVNITNGVLKIKDLSEAKELQYQATSGQSAPGCTFHCETAGGEEVF